MSATAAPYGARPVGTLSATGSWTAKRIGIPITGSYGTAIFYGDFVQLVAAGTLEKDTGTTTLNPVGIFVGCSYTDPTTGQPTHSQQWPASNAAADPIGWVVNDPDVIFEMQSATTVPQTELGLNFIVTQTAGSTSIGTSKNSLAASPVVTATIPIRVIGFKDGIDSAVGDAFTDCLCVFNAPNAPLTVANGHQYRVALGF